jgi:hypothetical protein
MLRGYSEHDGEDTSAKPNRCEQGVAIRYAAALVAMPNVRAQRPGRATRTLVRCSVKFDATIFAVASVMTYCMSSSVRRSTAGAIVNPSALEVFWLITSSNLVGCKTGSSTGFAPLRMRPTYRPSCRKTSA